MITRGIGILPADFTDSIEQSMSQQADSYDAGDHRRQADDLASTFPVRAFAGITPPTQKTKHNAPDAVAQHLENPVEHYC